MANITPNSEEYKRPRPSPTNTATPQEYNTPCKLKEADAEIKDAENESRIRRSLSKKPRSPLDATDEETIREFLKPA